MADSYGPYQAAPNSEGTSMCDPDDFNGPDSATYPGTRYGKGGDWPGEGDHSSETIVVTGNPLPRNTGLGA